MSERDQTSEPVVPSSGKSWGLRFSLEAMMVIVALFAGVFGYFSYFRPARCLLTYQVVTLAAEDLEGLGLDFQFIDDSPYRWSFDTNDAVAELVRQKGQVEKPLYEKQMTVANWPYRADTYTYIRPTKMSTATSPHPEFKSGEFAGFWGVRKVGSRVMFRVAGQTAHRQPVEDTEMQHAPGQVDEVSGTLAYEGELPTSKLIFAAPFGNKQVHLFLIDAKEVSSTEPVVYQPGPIESSELTSEQRDPQPEAVDNSQ